MLRIRYPVATAEHSRMPEWQCTSTLVCLSALAMKSTVGCRYFTIAASGVVSTTGMMKCSLMVSWSNLIEVLSLSMVTTAPILYTAWGGRYF